MTAPKSLTKEDVYKMLLELNCIERDLGTIGGDIASMRKERDGLARRMGVA